jgi:hypothetical protein
MTSQPRALSAHSSAKDAAGRGGDLSASGAAFDSCCHANAEGSRQPGLNQKRKPAERGVETQTAPSPIGKLATGGSERSCSLAEQGRTGRDAQTPVSMYCVRLCAGADGRCAFPLLSGISGDEAQDIIDRQRLMLACYVV